MKSVLTLLLSIAASLFLYSQNDQELLLVTEEEEIPLELNENKQAQTFGKWSIGLNLGLSQNGTDTHSWGRHAESIFSHSHLAYGLQAKYSMSQRFGLRLDYIGSKISGDDRDTDGPCRDEMAEDTDLACHRDRAWQFSSPIHELSLNFEWDILGNRRINTLKYYDEFGNQLEPKNVNKLEGVYYDQNGNVLDKRRAGDFKRILSPYISIGAALTYVDPSVIYPINDETPSDEDIKRSE